MVAKDDEPPPDGPDAYGAPDIEIPEGFMLTERGLEPCLEEPGQANGAANGEVSPGMPPPKVLGPHLWDHERLRAYTPVPREWVVTGRIPVGEICLLTGPGGLGKSTLAIQLQIAMAGGIDWLGYETKQTNTIGLYCEEDINELARRFQGVRRRLGVDWSDMHRAVYFPLKGQEVLLTEIDRRDGWVDPSLTMVELREYIDRLESRLVILDSLNRLFQGNENDRVQVTGFLRELEALATSTKCAILLLGHPSKSAMVDGSGYSGSTGWDSMVRSRAYLSYQHVPNPELLTPEEMSYPLLCLSWKKANYSSKSPDIEIQISFDDKAAEDEPPIFERIALNETDNRSLFLRIVDQLNAEGDFPRPTDRGAAKMLYCPTAVYQHAWNKPNGKRQITAEQCGNIYSSLMGQLGLLKIVPKTSSGRHKFDIIITVPMDRHGPNDTDPTPHHKPQPQPDVLEDEIPF